MQIRAEEVLRIASLAKLDLEPSEVEKFRHQLEAILDHVATLDRLGVGGTPPTAHALEEAGGGRPDEPAPSLDVAEALANAPDPAAGHFRVPRVLSE